jgi:hypothetical protein
MRIIGGLNADSDNGMVTVDGAQRELTSALVAHADTHSAIAWLVFLLIVAASVILLLVLAVVTQFTQVPAVSIRLLTVTKIISATPFSLSLTLIPLRIRARSRE